MGMSDVLSEVVIKIQNQMSVDGEDFTDDRLSSLVEQLDTIRREIDTRTGRYSEKRAADCC